MKVFKEINGKSVNVVGLARFADHVCDGLCCAGGQQALSEAEEETVWLPAPRQKPRL